MVKVKTFKKMLQKTQEELKKVLAHFLIQKDYNPIVGDGFIYAEGDIPILLVAHMDTVHFQQPIDIYFDSTKNVMWSPQGIGGDDRCGVYIITKLLNEFKPYILFTEDEERGCIGADKATQILKKPNVKFIVEIDRRGSDDCVFYDCGNEEFQKYIEQFGFKTAIGSFSDICVLSSEWNIASVNLSAGYYSEHTTSEIINIEDMKNTYNRVREILLDDVNNKTYFDYQEKIYTYHYTPAKTKKTKYEDDYLYWDENGYVGEDGYYHSWDEDDYWDTKKKD